MTLLVWLVVHVHCRPFSFVDGPGFHDLAAKLISTGATYGKVELIDIKQVTMTLHLIAIECSTKIQFEIRNQHCLLSFVHSTACGDGWGRQ